MKISKTKKVTPIFKIDLKKQMQENGNGEKQSNESFQKVLEKEIKRKKQF